MKILHIISSGGMYGAEAVILNMSRMLNEGGHSSMLGVFSNSSNPNLQLHESAVKEGVESHLIACAGQIDRRVPARIRALVAETGADVVHAHGYKGDVYAYLALRGSRTPLMSTCHNWLENSAMVALYGRLDRYVLRSYAAVVAVSNEVKQWLLGAGVREEKIHLIRNGIDLRPFDAAPPSLREERGLERAVLVGWIGRLSHEKGVDIFLRTAARVLVEFPEVRFVVVGDGPDRDKVEALIDDLKLRGSVFLLGRRDDMPSVYASLDVMVSSSRQEGLPMAILEGMASGLPLVATAVGDVPSVVLDGRTGVVVPVGEEESLAARLLQLLRDKALRERYGVAGRKLVEQEFSARRMTDAYLRVYEEVIATEKRIETGQLKSADARNGMTL